MTGLVGTSVDSVAFEVERGKIGEFARATRARDSVHTDRDAAARRGFPDVLATATHVVACGHYRDQGAMVGKLGLDISRVVVGSVSWEFQRALVAGDALTGTRRVVADETREGRRGGIMRVVTLQTDFADQGGQIAVSQREVLIERGRQ
jgi:acyl dehydratase